MVTDPVHVVPNRARAKAGRKYNGRIGVMAEVYRYFDADDRLLYVGVSANSVARMIGHRSAAEWWPLATRIAIERFETREQALEAEYEAIVNERPLHNKWPKEEFRVSLAKRLGAREFSRMVNESSAEPAPWTPWPRKWREA